MAVNVKMGVDIGGFKNGIKEGQQILKTLDAEMKVAEAEFKATGNAEQLLANKTKTLTSQMNVQKGIMKNAEQALKQMTDAGIKPTDKAYQQLTQQMLKAQAGMLDAQAALNGLDQSQEQAADSADKLSKSVNSIGQKISLDQVISGINTITSGLENAAKKAVNLGETIWNNIMNSAKWADDTATMALMYGIDIDTFQRMQKLVTNGMDTSVDAILKSQQKLMKGIGGDNATAMKYLNDFGLVIDTFVSKTETGGKKFITEDSLDLFFRAGQAIMNMGDSIEAEAEKENAAQNIFGRSWKELIPLFTQYKTVDEYREALDGVNVLQEEEVNQLADLNDKYNELKGNWETLQQKVGAALAPALTKAAEALNGVLDELLKYLESEKGQEMLASLGDAVAELLKGITDMSAEDVVKKFGDLLGSLTEGLKWIKDNGETVVGIIEGLGLAFAGLKVSSMVLTFLKLVTGLKDLGIFGSKTASTAAETAGGGAVSAISGFMASALPKLQTFSSTNGGPVVDWLTHNSPLGPVFMGQESFGDFLARMAAEQAERTAGFMDNWNPYSEDSNIFAKIWLTNAQTIDKAIENLQATNGWVFDEHTSADELMEMINNGNPVPVETAPEVPENAAQDISQQVGVVPIMAQIYANGMAAAGMMGLLGGGNVKGHANGLWSVPYDGYLARLHRGERIMPAREVASRNYSSNLYVESMYMNNGTDAAGLAAAMAAAQRRTMSGYGS